MATKDANITASLEHHHNMMWTGNSRKLILPTFAYTDDGAVHTVTYKADGSPTAMQFWHHRTTDGGLTWQSTPAFTEASPMDFALISNGTTVVLFWFASDARLYYSVRDASTGAWDAKRVVNVPAAVATEGFGIWHSPNSGLTHLVVVRPSEKGHGGLQHGLWHYIADDVTANSWETVCEDPEIDIFYEEGVTLTARFPTLVEIPGSGHIALGYLISSRQYTNNARAFVQLFDGQAWDAPVCVDDVNHGQTSWDSNAWQEGVENAVALVVDKRNVLHTACVQWRDYDAPDDGIYDLVFRDIVAGLPSEPTRRRYVTNQTQGLGVFGPPVMTVDGFGRVYCLVGAHGEVDDVVIYTTRKSDDGWDDSFGWALLPPGEQGGAARVRAFIPPREFDTRQGILFSAEQWYYPNLAAGTELCTLLVPEEIDPFDFTHPLVKQALANPGTISLSLGTDYSESYEEFPVTKQALTKVEISDDDLYVTFHGESFITRLDKTIFYGGRYDPNGIPASQLFAEILEDAQFHQEGDWAYIIGAPDCKTSATKPIWNESLYAYYAIDPALESVRVHVPIPPVSHREALTMVAAYSGAHLYHRSDGYLIVSGSLPAPTPEYHIDLRRVYERPKMEQENTIARINGRLYQCVVGGEVETIAEAALAAVDQNAETFKLLHDPCVDASLTLTGATLIGTPIYRVYSTTFVATPSGGSFTARLTGKRITINEAQFSVDYPNPRGETVDFSCPIASDVTLTKAMYDRYYKYATARRYTFSMRDDAALEVGDRVYLDLLTEPKGIPVLITEIKRSFNGALDAEYVVVEDSWEVV